MSVKRFVQPFQTQPSGFTAIQHTQICADTPNWAAGSNLPQRSPGATAVIGGGTLPSTPRKDTLSTPPYSLISLSVTAYLAFMLTPGGASIPYGRFGKIVAGTDPGSVTPFGGFVFGNSQQPWSVVMEPLPPDASLISDLWNPASNEMPPPFTPTGNVPDALNYDQLLPVSATIAPPVPIALPGTNAPYVGIWMLPSIYGAPIGLQGGNAGLALFFGTSVLTYDDGS